MKKIFSCILCVIFFCTAFSSSIAAYINWDIGGISNWGAGDEYNKWGLVPYDPYYSQLEGLRVTIVDNSDKSQPFGSVDFTGYNQVNDISIINNYSYTSKLTYLKNTTINFMMSKSSNNYSAVYNAKFADIDIISGHEIDKIKEALLDTGFLSDLCEEFSGLSYQDVVDGKYSIMFEPVAYFLYQGGCYAMTATEVGIFNRYQHQMFAQMYGSYSRCITAEAYNAGIANGSISLGSYLTYDGTLYYWSSLRSSLTPLTHGNLPRSAYLETDQFGIEAYVDPGTQYAEDEYIIKCMGVGFLSDHSDELEIQEDAEEVYHTDTWVYTSLYFYNNSMDDFVYLVDTDNDVLNYELFNEDGELTSVSKKAPLSTVTMYSEPLDSIETKTMGSFKPQEGILDGDGGAEVEFIIVNEKGELVKREVVTVGCPHQQFATVYYKWKTPSTPQTINIIVRSEDGMVSLTENELDIVDSIKIAAKVERLTENVPPNPTVSDERPSWFKVYNYESIQNNLSGIVNKSKSELVWYEWVATWEQDFEETINKHSKRVEYGATVWRYSSMLRTWTHKFKVGTVYLTGFEKVEHRITLDATMTIKPDSQVFTATQDAYGVYTMKSGYGINIEIDSHITGETDMCTGLQNGNVLFPEFNFNKQSTAKYNRLLEEVNGTLQFKTNKYSTYNNRVHFTPIWYPDNKRYAVYAEIFDIWCPAGQLKMKFADYIYIKGNVYDDWHIAAVKP